MQWLKYFFLIGENFILLTCDSFNIRSFENVLYLLLRLSSNSHLPPSLPFLLIFHHTPLFNPFPHHILLFPFFSSHLYHLIPPLHPSLFLLVFHHTLPSFHPTSSHPHPYPTPFYPTPSFLTLFYFTPILPQSSSYHHSSPYFTSPPSYPISSFLTYFSSTHPT